MILKEKKPNNNQSKAIALLTSVIISKLCMIINENPDCAKSLFKDLTTAALDLVETPNKFVYKIFNKKNWDIKTNVIT